MPDRRMAVWLGLLISVLTGSSSTKALEPGRAAAKPSSGKATYGPPPLPLEQLPPEFQERVRSLVDRPTLRTQGPVEIFNCQPNQYFWLLDHPDLTVRLWRLLGAKVTDIDSQGSGRYSWHDNQGSLVKWDTLLRTERHRVWYAEGKIKPGLLLPTVTLRALLVVHHAEGQDGEGRPAIRHQIDLILQTDNSAVALAARVLGASAPHVAEQFVGQIEMFYGAMAWYLDQHPRQAVGLLREVQHPGRDLPARTRTPGNATSPEKTARVLTASKD